MDIATLLGIVSGLAIIFAAIALGSGIGIFVNVPSILIVIGGTIAATLIKFTLKDVVSALKIGISSAIKIDNLDPLYLIELSVDMAQKARKGGLISLEGEKIENELMAKGIQLCVDGHALEVVRDTLTKEISMNALRRSEGEKIFRGIGDSAPAFGMIGTLIGLVQMLSNMDDPKTIGPAMAVAMLTTFYGAVIANLIALPMADKLASKIAQEETVKQLILEAVMQIHGGQNPNVLREMLSVYVVGGAGDGEGGGGGEDEE